MPITKSILIKSIDIDLETGFINVKKVTRVEEDSEVLFEKVHRASWHRDDPQLSSEIGDSVLEADIKKVAQRARPKPNPPVG